MVFMRAIIEFPVRFWPGTVFAAPAIDRRQGVQVPKGPPFLGRAPSHPACCPTRPIQTPTTVLTANSGKATSYQ